MFRSIALILSLLLCTVSVHAQRLAEPVPSAAPQMFEQLNSKDLILKAEAIDFFSRYKSRDAMLRIGNGVAAADLPEARDEVLQRLGNIDAVIDKLDQMLLENYPAVSFAEFVMGRARASNDESARHAATRILALQRMGKVSIHSAAVKRAFAYQFLTAYADQTRQHEALELYERIAVAHADDPFWQIIRARCARLMHLPEVPKLYEQVAADIERHGLKPDTAWGENGGQSIQAARKEFLLNDHTKALWARHTRLFVNNVLDHAPGTDVPPSPVFEGSPFPLLDLASAQGQRGARGLDADDWLVALQDSAQTKALDALYAHCEKHGELPWVDGRGFLNSKRALTMHLLSKPAGELAVLRELQEAAFQAATAKASAKATDEATPLTLFRRYPWSESAQRQLHQSARQHLFAGQPHATYRGFQDVLRHAKAKELREPAQVGLWVSLAQFAEPGVVAQAFEGIDAKATWPWYGKREKTGVIKAALVKKDGDQTPSPTLASLKPNTIRLPPIPVGSVGMSAFSIDMQRDGGQLLVSGETMLLMYDAETPTKPVWSVTRRPRFTQRIPAGQFVPLFDHNQVITRWGSADNSPSDAHSVAFNRLDGSVASDGTVIDSRARYKHRLIGSPARADNRVYWVQTAQTAAVLAGPVHRRGETAIGLSCFDLQGMAHRWTRLYDAVQTLGPVPLIQSVAAQPVVREGAVYFFSNAGHVIRADTRDGEMEWVHFFRPTQYVPHHTMFYWHLGASPIVTDDKVICMPKFSGRIFALDKETGRRVWVAPFIRGFEFLGLYEGQLLVVGANSLYAVDVETGALRWGRQIADEHLNGFQLPRAQLIGSSVYCGTKKRLYRFDAKSGFLQESRPWEMGGEVPMSFLIAGTDLYAISDLALRDKELEDRLADFHNIIFPGLIDVDPRHKMTAGLRKLKDGTSLVGKDGMLIRFIGDQVLWSRFVSNSASFIEMNENETQITVWRGTHITSIHDAVTGQLLHMGPRGRLKMINIGKE